MSVLVWPVQAALIAWAISDLIAGEVPAWYAALLFILLSGVRAGLDWRAEAAAQVEASRSIADLRLQLLEAAVWRSPSGPGEDAAAQAALMGEKAAMLRPWLEKFLPAMARARIVPLVILGLVASQSWTAALALAVTGPLIPVFMMLIGYAAQAASRDHLVEAGALNRLLMDRIAALADLRFLGAVGQAGADLETRATDLRERVMKVLRLAFLSSTVLELMASLGVALVAVQMGVSLLGLVSWGGWGGQISAFGAIFVLLIVPEFYQPMRDLAASWHDRAAAMAVMDEARAALAQEGPRILGEGAAPPARCDRPLPLRWQGLVISPGQDAAIAVPDGCLLPRTATAVTGPSGIGKTTLLGTLAGLRPALSGTIRYGDIRLSDATATGLRGAIGWLPQQPRFPAMSLRRWLRLAAPDATDDTLTEALHRARAGHVLAALPQGLGTRLGETGGGVSGGEARRLMIARALLAPPTLLLADEPTADLDATSAQEITGALLALRELGSALLIATHDARLIGAMDHVIALRAGREAA
ncbi:ABC transporter ATP-binding protein/permease [Celeribacter indicus]|uniref:Cysteine ABC transporter ATP-binding protein/permease CydD n=1 Tax=Celeribacter indicus TaxID=1208324 RepID=A0A0B5DQB1_9RHOB|nr:ATP-binding cassette domain-containing protein [Celeribacter indicus]AJE45728.1 cysteine ABC transporter ATP-binding protein/permease CydD [Celeribacter indicus]